MKRRKRLVLLYGGEGEEHEVSLKGAEYVLPLINREKYSVLKIKIERTGEWFAILGRGRKLPAYPVRLGTRAYMQLGQERLRIDLCLPLLHGRCGEDGRVQGLLSVLGIPFVGCDTVSGAVCFDKHYTKLVARSVGVPVAGGISLPAELDGEGAAELVEQRVGYPAFIKPRRQGSSVGVSLARHRGELLRALEAARTYGEGGILAEEVLCDKRELEVAYLCYGGNEIVTPPGEILCRGTYGYKEKYSGTTLTQAVADIPSSIAGQAREYTLLLAHALGVRTLGRFDFFLEGDRLLFNEVNTFPGFTRDSLYPQMMRAWGLSEGELVDILLESAYAGNT